MGWNVTRVPMIAAATLLLAVPTAASAGDAACVWQALPESVRVSSMSAYAQKRIGGILSAESGVAIAQAITACVVHSDDEQANKAVTRAATMALSGYLMQAGS